MSLFSQSQKYRYPRIIIFDFDGVLADSLYSFYSLIKAGMKEIGLSLTLKQYRNFFIGNVHQGFKSFINNKQKYISFMDFRKNNYDRYYYRKNREVKLFPGTSSLVEKLSKKYILAIASSGRKNNIENLLDKNKIKNLFGLVLADSAFTKEGMIKEILNKFSAAPQEAIMISDTVGDVLIAKEIGLKTIAITWGFHSRKLLSSAQPDNIVKNMDKLKKLI